MGQGLQTFMISWRNPTPDQADWDMDTYVGRMRRAVDAAKEITGSPDVNTLGFCAGGILMTTLLNHLAATDATACTAPRTRSPCSTSTVGHPSGPSRGSGCSPSPAGTHANGVITARQMGSAFSWMRPDDLVFDYLVNQICWARTRPSSTSSRGTPTGRTCRPPCTSSSWSFRDNSLVTPGAMTVLGTPVDLSTITVPTFITGAMTDHLTPWTGCYRTTQLCRPVDASC